MVFIPLEPGVNIDANNSGPDCQVAAALGAKWVRVSLEQGASAAHLQEVKTAATNNGLLLMNTCQPTGHVAPSTSAGMTAWGDYVGQFSTVCDLTGTGNEPANFGGKFTPQQYAQMMLAAIAGRDKAGGGRLLTPEMAPGYDDPAKNIYTEPVGWICRMFDAEPTILKAKKLWAGWHGYCDGRWNPNTAALWNTCYQQRTLQVQLKKRGAGGKKIVNGEMGVATGPSDWVQKVSASDQALRLQQWLEECHNQESVGVVHGPWFWFQLRDRAPMSDWTLCSGLIDIHGAVKPSGEMFKTLAAAAPALVVKPTVQDVPTTAV